MKILIAEDNAFSRTLLKKTLVKAGYEAVVAENGDAAWELLQQPDPPCLALVDWMMPGLSGVELCRKIRDLDTPIPIYVILLTAKTDKEDVLEGFSAGADDFIKKPFDSGELLARLQVGRRLVEQQALMHCLIDSLPDPIYVKDNRGLYTSDAIRPMRSLSDPIPTKFMAAPQMMFCLMNLHSGRTWRTCGFWRMVQ